MSLIRYFISYVYTDNSGKNCFGWEDLSSSSIKDGEDLHKISESIEIIHDRKNVVILFFREFNL